ncbi:MAG: DUF58 domain-containing protein [Actinomycetota bacterium]
MNLFGQSTSTRAALPPRFAAIVLVVLAVVTGNKWLLVLGCACGAVLVVALVLRPRLDDLAVSASMAPRTSVGRSVDCLIEVTNTGNGWSPIAHGTHRVELLDDITFRIDALPPGGRASLVVARTAAARGIALHSDVLLATAAPLGLRLRKHTVDVPLRLIVHPAEVAVSVPEPRAGSDDTQWVVSRSGIDVHGIRDWRPGDVAGQVHWRSSARRGRLVVLEREIPKPGGLALILAATAGDDSWESVVSVGAWTGVAAVAAGRDVTLIAAVAGGAELGPDDATTILDWCAQSKPVLPDQTQLAGAFEFVGRGGDIAVAAGPSAFHGWWHWAAALARSHEIELIPLISGPRQSQ